MNKQRGFTIIELMIATLIFSLIMLVVAAGILKFTHAYFKGVNSSDTQQVARSIIGDISQNIQFGKTVTIKAASSGSPQGLCIDNNLYSYRIGVQTSDTTHALIKTTANDCSVTSPVDVTTITGPLAAGSRELVGTHMRLGVLDVQPVGDKLYSIHLKLIYGDDDVLTDPSNPDTTACRTDTGSEFCAISELETTVNQRQ